MEVMSGFVVKKKEYYRNGKLSGLSFQVTKDVMKSGGEWFSFWLNSDEDKELYTKYKPVIDSIPNSNEEIKSIQGFYINGSYETNDKGFMNLKTFEIEKHDGDVPKEMQEGPEKPVVKEVPVQPTVADAKIRPSDVTTEGANWANKFTQKDTLMARMSALKAAGPIVAEEVRLERITDAEQRTITLSKRFMKFIESGE